MASSSTSSAGRRSTARANATRCFSPPLRRSPRSPTTVSYPSAGEVSKEGVITDDFLHHHTRNSKRRTSGLLGMPTREAMHDGVVDVRQPGCLLHFLVTGISAPIPDVVTDGAVEQDLHQRAAGSCPIQMCMHPQAMYLPTITLQCAAQRCHHAAGLAPYPEAPQQCGGAGRQE